VKLPYQKLEKLKQPHKLAILFGTLALFGVVFYFLLYSPVTVKIKENETVIADLEAKITQHKQKARDIPIIKKRLDEVRLQFEFAKKFLPTKKEVHRLLEAISENGHQSGLNVVFFKPQPETKKDFYAEIAFDMKVEGPYLNVANFFYRLGRLERIVNIENVRMAQPKLVDGEMTLTADCLGKTFRFLTSEEIEEQKTRAAAKGKK
jgi:type IV pilus assembly protein PilO